MGELAIWQLGNLAIGKIRDSAIGWPGNSGNPYVPP
jgi:hypothetical protein